MSGSVMVVVATTVYEFTCLPRDHLEWDGQALQGQSGVHLAIIVPCKLLFNSLNIKVAIVVVMNNKKQIRMKSLISSFTHLSRELYGWDGQALQWQWGVNLHTIATCRLLFNYLNIKAVSCKIKKKITINIKWREI